MIEGVDRLWVDAGGMGGAEEGNSVVAAAPSLRRYQPCEQRTLAWGPVLRQSGAHSSRKSRAVNGATRLTAGV